MKPPLQVAIALAGWLVSCSDDDPSPSLRDVVITPPTATAGEALDFEFSFTVEDPDGDVDVVCYVLTDPDGRAVSAAHTTLGNQVGEQTVATAQVDTRVAVDGPGQYTFTLWIRDDAGNESERREVFFTAE